ncbi:glycosyltransferase [Treponema sp.]|uniref:glycosyltransferase n=1 Tax=Treponema sp. TaxID=166 RepID=UPI00298D97D4|nr:glycosyltransferase [Treponema sp.]MCQ2240622.1 glycosyltransferase [Treponema sp.]
MKIAMFTDAYFPRINGVTVSVHSFAEELTKLGHEIAIVCLEYTEEQQKSSFFDESSDDALPFKIIRIPSSRVVFSKEDRMGRLDKWHFVKKAMDAFKPDVVHINSEFVAGYFGSIYARHRRIPSVFTFHTLWEDYLANYMTYVPKRSSRKLGKEVVRFYLKRTDVIIAPTKRIAEVVKEYGIDRESHIIPTGIPSSKLAFSKKQNNIVINRINKKFPGIRGKKILLYVGRVVKEKNLEFLFDVLREVQKTMPKTALLLVGGGPALSELQEKAKELGLEKSVFFTGYIEGSNLIYFYRRADVFTFPSKTETQGLVTVEAMLSGLPVVAIGEMGTLDVMQGDNGGFMVSDDVTEFTGRVLELLKNKKLHEEKSREAMDWAEKWKISSLTPTLVECYEEAIRIHETKHRRQETK